MKGETDRVSQKTWGGVIWALLWRSLSTQISQCVYTLSNKDVSLVHTDIKDRVIMCKFEQGDRISQK